MNTVLMKQFQCLASKNSIPNLPLLQQSLRKAVPYKNRKRYWGNTELVLGVNPLRRPSFHRHWETLTLGQLLFIVSWAERNCQTKTYSISWTCLEYRRDASQKREREREGEMRRRRRKMLNGSSGTAASSSLVDWLSSPRWWPLAIPLSQNAQHPEWCILNKRWNVNHG